MRRAKLNLTYHNVAKESAGTKGDNGAAVDISRDVADRLIGFTYSDNKQGEADDIEITVQNRDGIWMRDWYPDKGARLTAGLTLEDWEKAGDDLSV